MFPKALAVALLLACAAAEGARAAGCCLTTALFGVGRLAMWEQSAAGARFTRADTLGSWSADAAFRPNGAGYFEGELRLDSFGILRLTDALELSALLPLIEGTRGVGANRGTGAAFGDAQLALRLEVLDLQHAGAWPTVAVLASALLPTGKRFEESRVPFAADANSRGAFGAGFTLSLDKTVDVFFGHLDIGATSYLPSNVTSAGRVLERRLGPGVSGALTLGLEVLPPIVVGAFVSTSADLPSSLGGTAAPKSSALATNAGLTAAWALDPHWTVVGNVGSGLFVDGLGANRPGQVSGSLGVRYGAFQ